jgi:hypothetical protein
VIAVLISDFDDRFFSHIGVHTSSVKEREALSLWRIT